MRSDQFQFAPYELAQEEGDWLITQSAAGAIKKAWYYCSANEECTSSEAADAQALVQAHPELTAIPIPENFLVLPTAFDLQTHLRFPGQEDKESLEGGLEAAFCGGYDSVCAMPNTSPFLDTPERIAQAIADYQARVAQKPAYPKALFTASATVGMQGVEAADIIGLVKSGATGITDDGWGVRESAAMATIFQQCAEADVVFMQHAEIAGHGGVTPESAFQTRYNLPVYPRTAESEMVARDIALLKKNPQARYHVLHVSTVESLAEIKRAKEAGLKVTCEVTPHHLIFSNADIPGEENSSSTNYKMNPPLFSPEDRSALREALREGLIDCVSTDHAPHTAESKTGGWKLSPFGTRGLVSALPALISLYRAKELSWSQVESVFCSKSRKILGSNLNQNSEGLLFIDPDFSFQLSESDLPGHSRNSCFLDAQLWGRIAMRTQKGNIFRRTEGI